MKKLKNIDIFQLLMAMIVSLASISCVDDKLTEDEGNSALQEDGNSLGLTISLGSLSCTRAASEYEEYEDYIDPNQINLLFFYNDNIDGVTPNTLIKQFSSNELTFIPIESSVDGSVKNWYVRIPNIENDFAAEVRKHDFKVAALVNWGEEAIEINPEDPISKLHHLQEDNTYSGKSYYKFLTEGTDLMGKRTNWVKNDFHKAHFNDAEGGQNSAEYWIRNYWYKNDKDVVVVQDNINKYGDLWLIWNFDAAYRNSVSSFDFQEENGKGKSEEYWAEKNYNDLNSWIQNSNLSSFQVGNTTIENGRFTPTDNGCFEFYGEATRVEVDVNGTNKIGVNLKNGDYETNVIKFNLATTGTINIKWGAKDTTKEARLQFQRRNSPTDTKSKDNDADYLLTTNDKYTSTPIADKDSKWNFSVTGDTEYAYLYALDDNVVIYEIEFIASEYLYEIEREGVYPGIDEGQPLLIAMYGIQEFQALEGFWKEGTLFNLSNYNKISSTYDDEYEPQEISLLRSVAKVELLIPKTFYTQNDNDPELKRKGYHCVYLRCQNRQARFEPMDVSTPTDQIWRHSTNDDCEQIELIGHEPFFGSSTDYKQNLAWFYGSWKDTAGKIGNPKETDNYIEVPVKTFGTETGDKTPAYPQIINPRIERSDFTRFIYTGEVEGGVYDRYILYVPDKFVDDPNKPEEPNKTPKVCHIEFRQGANDEHLLADSRTNLDDNNCYRIYFTKGGFNSEDKSYPNFNLKKDGTDDKQTWENMYEQDSNNLKKHWPIMRNHVYSFRVEDASQRIVIVNINVLPWKEVTGNSYNW